MDPTDIFTGAAIAVFMAIVGLIWKWTSPSPSNRADSLRAKNQASIKAALQEMPSLEAAHPGQRRAIEHEFNKVFMLTLQESKEALITGWMRKGDCDRTLAMSLAVDEWRRENH